MPVYYDDNKAIFDYLDEIVNKADSFCIDSYLYSSYIWEDDHNVDEFITHEQKAAYEEVLYDLGKRFSHLSDEDAELYLLEYIQTDEEEEENLTAEDWKDELRSLLEAVQTSINADDTPDISVILGGSTTSN
jgi:hypothetical protein